MDAEQIDAVFVDQAEDFFVILGGIKADAHLDGEETGHGVTEGSKQFIDFGRIAQQAAADILFVDLGCRAAHVQVDTGDRILE